MRQNAQNVAEVYLLCCDVTKKDGIIRITTVSADSGPHIGAGKNVIFLQDTRRFNPRNSSYQFNAHFNMICFFMRYKRLVYKKTIQ